MMNLGETCLLYIAYLMTDKALSLIKEDILLLVHRVDIFREIYDTYGMPTVISRPSDFSTVIHIILEQQVSLDSGLAAFDRLKSRFGRDLDPIIFAEAGVDTLMSCGLTKQKAAYIHNLAILVSSNTIKLDQVLSNDNHSIIYDNLVSIKGIGPWTANIILMTCVGSRDIFPTGDIALINEMKSFNLILSVSEVSDTSAMWSPYRTAAAHLLWHSYLRRKNRTIPM